MSAQDLSQMGTAKVTLISDGEGNSAIEKYPVSHVEYAFYQYAANRLNHAGIATPELLFAEPSLNKLRLEYIPHKVTQYAVSGDNVLATLARLHSYPPNPSWVYHNHSWSESALEKSLIFLQLPNRAAQQMRCFQQCSDTLFRSQGLISGDSNAGNWGTRDNGDVVLFDWERFGTGSPAIDLAPLIRGMGTIQKFVELADRYCHISSDFTGNDLAKEIAIAKAWIVTEVVLLLKARQKSNVQFYINWYKENLPVWLNNTVKIL